MANNAGSYYIYGRLLYTFLCTFPYMALVLFTFRGHWRFKKPVAIVIMLAIVAFQMSTLPVRLYLSEYIPYQFFDILTSVIYIAFIFVEIKAHIGKLIFTVLVLTNLGNFVVTSAKCLENIFFPVQAAMEFFFTYHLFIALVLIAVIPVIYLLVFKNISSPDESQSETYAENSIATGYLWRYMWLVPGVFYLIGTLLFYTAGDFNLKSMTGPVQTLYLLAIAAGSVMIYRIIIQTVDLYDKNAALREENHTLSIQRLRYESLNERLENMRRTRHDIRHHVALLKQIRDSGDISALDDMISMYTKQNMLDQPLIYCENETVNIVLALYSETADQNSIAFSVKANIPNDIFADKKDLVVLFGNILENAADACREVEKDRFIDLVATYSDTPGGIHCLSLIAKNSCGTVSRDDNGVFHSTKHIGDGIGINSVKSISNKYNGACSFTADNGIFTVSVILYGRD